MTRRFLFFAAALLASLTLGAPSLAQAAAPTITSVSFSGITTDSATLKAQINPEEKATKYRFEYGTADCSANPCTALPEPDGLIPAKAIGAGDLASGSNVIANVVVSTGSFNAGNSIQGVGIPASTTIIEIDPSAKTLTLSQQATASGTGVVLTATGLQPVSAQLKGLTPGTTYHFRVLAENAAKEKAQSKDFVFKTYALPPVFGPCPNDQFRQGSNLPDCRAYEQASPVDKNGGDLWSKPSWLAASTQGDAVIFLNDAGIPGGVGGQELPAYLATREGSGWASNGLLPPATKGQYAKVLGWLPDLSEVFSKAGTYHTQPFSFALLGRSSAEGSISTLASYAPSASYDYAGASSDGSKILFESNAALTPGAKEGSSNLYLWDRATEELHLAGALNDAKTPSKGAFAGPYDWFKGTNPTTLGKGGAARDYYVQEANAISNDGKAVFFTAAGTGSLYLRKNPTEEQSALDSQENCTEPLKACTIQVNVSVKDNGKGDEDKDAAGPQPAAFQAASADGKVVYFTSSEKLTNESNTGLGEPEPAAIARAGIDGKDPDLSCLPTRAFGIAVDDEHLYWASPQGTIGRADLDCKDPDEAFITLPPVEVEEKPGVFVSVARIPQYVAVNDTHIYWTAKAAGEEIDSDPLGKGGTIGRAELNGDGPATEVEADLVTGLGAPQGVALNSTHLFWANTLGIEKRIGRAELDGENPDRDFIEMTNERIPYGVAANDSHVYFAGKLTTGLLTFVRRFDLDGESNEKALLYDTPADIRGIAIDANHVYWASTRDSTIGRANLDLDSATDEPTFIDTTGSLAGIAVNANHLYWSSNGETSPNPGNDLYRYEVETGELTDLSIDPLTKAGAEVRGVLGASEDGEYLYFAANGVLSPGATPGDCKGGPPNGGPEVGACNVYLMHGDSIEFVARVDAGDRNWRPTPSLADFNPRTSRLTPDGQTLLFSSGFDYHLYDASVKTITCITCNPTGEAGGADSGSIQQSGLLNPPAPAAALTHLLSDDGKRVFFETTAALVGADVNGRDGCPKATGISKLPTCRDVYEWEAEGSGSCKEEGGCIYLRSPGTGNESSFFAGASASGDDVFIFTRAQLVGQDKDNLRDVYDVRVGGGLSSQHPQEEPICESKEACEKGIADSPAADSAATQAFQGPPNPPIARKPRCPKGRRLVRVKGKSRCVVKRKGDRRNPKRTGRTNR